MKENFYPSQIFRILGGGILPSESSSDAIIREIKEETGANLGQNQIIKLGNVKTKALTNQGLMIMSTDIFYYQIDGNTQLVAGDDVSDLVYLSLQEFKELIVRMNLLEGDFVTDKYSFSWTDWGIIYGFIHSLALELYFEVVKTC